MYNFLIGVVFAGLLAVTFLDVQQSSEYQKKCADAGGVPSITAHGPDVCINPSAIIEVYK